MACRQNGKFLVLSWRSHYYGDHLIFFASKCLQLQNSIAHSNYHILELSNLTSKDSGHLHACTVNVVLESRKRTGRQTSTIIWVYWIYQPMSLNYQLIISKQIAIMLHFMYFRKFIRFQWGQHMPIQAVLSCHGGTFIWSTWYRLT